MFLNQDTYYLNETNPVNFGTDGAYKFIIQPEFLTKEYISIVFTPSDNSKKSPAAIVSAGSESCNQNKIAMSTQYSGQIYIFLKKGLIEKEGNDDDDNFVICTEEREGAPFGEYSIEVKITEVAELPMGQQTSYFVDAYNTNMKFNLINQLSNLSFGIYSEF